MIQIEKLKSKKGYSLLTFLVTIPFIAFFIVYFVSSYTYGRYSNMFEQATNAAFDRILVEGQLTNEIEQEMYNKFSKLKLSAEDITIRASDTTITDGNDSTYVGRGNTIQIQFVYSKPHFFYYVNKLVNPFATESAYYLTNVTTGMSEKL